MAPGRRECQFWTGTRGQLPRKEEDNEYERVSTVADSIIQADEDYAAHQCNCVIRRPAKGVAQTIFAQWPHADVYLQRKQANRMIDEPGTASVHGRVINLYGQFLPGRPPSRFTNYYKNQDELQLLQERDDMIDSSEERLTWAREALWDADRQLEKGNQLRSPPTWDAS